MGFLPDNYKDSKTIKKEAYAGDPRYFEPGNLNNGDMATIRPCGTFSSGHVIAGYSYFSTTQKRTLRFPVFPEDYAEDIGISYDARKNGTKEKDTPKYFLSFVGLSREQGTFLVVTIPQNKLREKIERILGMADYSIADGEMANFFLTITKDKGTDGFTSYDALPTLKPPTAAEKKRWSEAASGICLPALFSGADPFAGRAATPGPGVGMPPTSRDELGADHELDETKQTGDDAGDGWAEPGA